MIPTKNVFVYFSENHLIGPGPVPLLLALVISACSSGAPMVDRVSTDSAGVRIVELTVDRATNPNVLLDSAVVAIASEGDTFSLFRVTAGVLFANGGFAVANAGFNEILVFDSTGSLSQRLGRLGSGPGEFRGLDWLAIIPPDSLVAGDTRLQRVSVFDPYGRLGRTIDVNAAAADVAADESFSPQPIGVFRDGSVAVASYHALRPVAGPARRLITVGRLLPDTRQYQAFGTWVGDEFYLLPTDGRLQVLTPAFARSTKAETFDDMIAIADTEIPEVLLFRDDGSLRGIIRWRMPDDRELTDAITETVIREKLRSLGDGPALEQRVAEHRRIALHKTLPSFGSVLVDSSRKVWLSNAELPGDEMITWFGTGFAAGDSTIHKLHLPANTRILAISGNYLLALVRDSMERESVHRFGLKYR